MFIKKGDYRTPCNMYDCRGKQAKYTISHRENSHNPAADLFVCESCLEGIALALPEDIVKKVIEAHPELVGNTDTNPTNQDYNPEGDANQDNQDSQKPDGSQTEAPKSTGSCGQCIRKFNKKGEEPCLTCKEEGQKTGVYPSFEKKEGN